MIMRKDLMTIKSRLITKDRTRYLLIYTILFVICFFFCYQLYFSNYGKTYMFSYDAIDNNYPFFIAVGRWWRRLVKNFTIRHTFEIPMWDMSIGYGADVITSFGNGFNNFFNPLYILSAFFPSSYSETAFKIVLILQIYLAGLSFTALASYKKTYSKYAILIGSLIYAFSSNTLIVFKQLSFGYAFVIFPLIILGIWLIRDKRKPYLFIVSTISMFTYSYYFTFMAVVLLLIYYAFLVAESLIVSKGKSLKSELKILLKLALSAMYSAAVGVLLILPSLIAITKLDRLDVNYEIPLIRDSYYAGRLVSGFVSVFDGWSDDLLGFPIIAFICIGGLFFLMKLKEGLRVKIMLILATVSLFIPYVGHVINGFSYSTNRWTWAYTLLVSFIVTMVFDKLYNAKIWKLALIIGMLVAYEIVVIKCFDINGPEQKVPVMIGILVIVFIMISRLFSREDFEKIMVLITVLALAVPNFFYFSQRYMNIQSKLIPVNDAYLRVVQSGGKEALVVTNDDSLYRYDTLTGRLKNSSLITGKSGYDSYNSIYNPNINKLQLDLGLTSSASPSVINGVCKRSDLEVLFGTKYVIRNANNLDNPLPYGYTHHLGHFITYDNNTYEVYTSSTDTSLVSFFTDSVDESYYDSLSAYDKQQLLMNAVVLPEGGSGYSCTEEKSIPYTITAGDYVELSDHKIKTNAPNSYIDINLEYPVEGSGEWYIYLDDLVCTSYHVLEFKNHVYFVVDPANIPVPEEEEEEETKEDTKKKDDIEDEETEEEEITEVPLGIGMFNATTSRYHMYGGKDSWLVNSGVVDALKSQKIRIVFETAAEYSYDDIKVFFEKEEKIESNINGLKHPASDLRIDDNTITSHVTLDQAGYLLMTIPYADGWTAYVDGKETEIIRADRAFMAFDLPAGEHEIILKYHTPYLVPGLAGAFALIACGIGYCVFGKKIKLKKKS